MTGWCCWRPEGIRDIRHEINRIFDDLAGREGGRFLMDRGWSPLLNVYRTPQEVVVVAELPGFDAKMLNVHVTEDTLVLAGSSPDASAPGDVQTRIERNRGSFERAVSLPGPVDGKRARAMFRNGLLRVAVPLVPEGSPRKISISGEDE